MQFTSQETDLLKLAITRMIEINNYQYGEMCCNIIVGTTDRSEDLQKLLAKVEASDPMELIDPFI